MKKDNIRIRDPFVLADPHSNCYYLYGTTDLGTDPNRSPESFSVYRSADLETFEGPFPVFEGRNFWGTIDYWAAEVHFYRGKYYLFGSFKADGKCRATQILRADSPMGPFAHKRRTVGNVWTARSGSRTESLIWCSAMNGCK